MTKPKTIQDWQAALDDLRAKRIETDEHRLALNRQRQELAFDAEHDAKAAEKLESMRTEAIRSAAKLEDLDAAIERAERGLQEAREAQDEATRDNHRKAARKHAEARVQAAQDVDAAFATLAEALRRWGDSGDAWARELRLAGDRPPSAEKVRNRQALYAAVWATDPMLHDSLNIPWAMPSMRRSLTERERVLTGAGVKPGEETAA